LRRQDRRGDNELGGTDAKERRLVELILLIEVDADGAAGGVNLT
jgi:hypothetical protein